VDASSQHVFGALSATALGIALLAVVPGLSEEILFRGALQPRIGLLATALLFTSTHTEYGLSFVTLEVLVLAIGLGLIRRYTNTTTSCVCHIAYNLLVALVSRALCWRSRLRPRSSWLPSPPTPSGPTGEAGLRTILDSLAGHPRESRIEFGQWHQM